MEISDVLSNLRNTEEHIYYTSTKKNPPLFLRKNKVGYFPEYDESNDKLLNEYISYVTSVIYPEKMLLTDYDISLFMEDAEQCVDAIRNGEFDITTLTKMKVFPWHDSINIDDAKDQLIAFVALFGCFRRNAWNDILTKPEVFAINYFENRLLTNGLTEWSIQQIALEILKGDGEFSLILHYSFLGDQFIRSLYTQNMMYAMTYRLSSLIAMGEFATDGQIRTICKREYCKHEFITNDGRQKLCPNCRTGAARQRDYEYRKREVVKNGKKG